LYHFGPCFSKSSANDFRVKSREKTAHVPAHGAENMVYCFRNLPSAPPAAFDDENRRNEFIWKA
jgi:hypothetical protein